MMKKWYKGGSCYKPCKCKRCRKWKRYQNELWRMLFI